MIKVGWIGLGVMGGPMARHLITRGDVELAAFNRTFQKAEDWLNTLPAFVPAKHARLVKSPAKAAHEADFVFSCVGDDPDLREIMLGPDGAMDALKPGAIVVDHTTTSADIAREMASHAGDRKAAFIDAPVSGGQSGAEQGILSIMAGGMPEAFEKALPLLQSYGRMVKLMGPAGSGQLTKMVNQICIAGLIQSLSEALRFAECADLNVADVIEVISKGAAQSWQMENRWETMRDGEFDFGFAVDWMRKDLAHCLAEAERNGADLPIAEIIKRFYEEIQRNGGGRFDTSSLITRLRPPP